MLNEIKSRRSYRNRWLAKNMREGLRINPVIVLTGARQTGKSTLLQNELPFRNWRYITFDDLDVLAQAKKDPEALLSLEVDTVIDEVQRAPEVLAAIKRSVDQGRRIRFLLSGSGNLLLMKQVSETLAGRALYFVLQLFARREWRRAGIPVWFFRLFEDRWPKESRCGALNPKASLFKGFLPPVFRVKSPLQASLWWEGYVRTYLERDLRELSQVASLSDFKKVMEMLALQTGGILNETDIARSLSMSQPTVHRYINLLETSQLFVKLRPYTKGKSKRIIKAPKAYFLDSGLASYLAGYHTVDSAPPEFTGHLFETMVFGHLSTLASLIRANMYYWRTFGGREREVDFVIEKGHKLIALEAKLSNKVNYGDIQNIMHFMNDNRACIAGLVVYTGTDLKYLTKSIIAVPWTALC